MHTLSTSSPKNGATKIHRSREVISRKWIAYQELTGSEASYTQRAAAKVLKIPRSTFQHWNASHFQEKDLDRFFSSPVGVEILHRIISAAHFVIQFRNCGSRGLQEFLELSHLERWAARSTGAVHNFASRFEAEVVAFGKEQQQALAKGMPKRKIALSEDETFHMGRPCLVAIELLSNYILVEEYAEQRRAEDWNVAVNGALKGLNVEILSSTSDGGTALLAHVKNELKVEHAPDLFHVQQDLSRATAGPLKAQEREMENSLEKEQKKLARAIAKHGEGSETTQEAVSDRNLRAYGLELRKVRREEVKASIKGIGQDYHPIDLATGEWQSPEKVKSMLEARMGQIEEAARKTELSNSCIKKIGKAKEQIIPMISYLTYFLLLLKRFFENQELSPAAEKFFREVLLPLAYLEWVFKKAPAKERKSLEPVLEKLKAKAREGPVQGEERETLQKQAAEVARWFQRSSSCVEGRNGVLSMKHHGAHRLSQRRLGALTVIHNFYTQRPDGTTAGERFFQQPHATLFEIVISRVQMLGKPRKRRAQREPLAA